MARYVEVVCDRCDVGIPACSTRITTPLRDYHTLCFGQMTAAEFVRSNRLDELVSIGICETHEDNGIPFIEHEQMAWELDIHDMPK